MSNQQGFATLDSWIRNLRSAKGLMKAAAQELAPVVEQKLKATISAGKTPLGTPWPAKNDGSRTLVNASDALSVETTGTVILIKLTGHYVLHHFGMARGHVRRQMIPYSSGDLALFSNAIRVGLVDIGKKWMARTP